MKTKEDISKLFEDFRRENSLPADTELVLVYDPENNDFKPALQGAYEGECVTCRRESF